MVKLINRSTNKYEKRSFIAKMWHEAALCSRSDITKQQKQQKRNTVGETAQTLRLGYQIKGAIRLFFSSLSVTIRTARYNGVKYSNL